MRFRTRVDWHEMIAPTLAAMGSATLLVLTVCGRVPLGSALWFWAFAACIFLSYLLNYCEIRAEGLFIRQPWRKALLPYESLVSIECVDLCSRRWLFSFKRILVVTKTEEFEIAVVHEGRFIRELSARCPHLVRKEFGLVTP